MSPILINSRQTKTSTGSFWNSLGTAFIILRKTICTLFVLTSIMNQGQSRDSPLHL